MQASLRASSPRGARMREGKGEDLIGKHQRSHRGFWGCKCMRGQYKLSLPFSLPHPHSFGRACSQAVCRSKNVLRGKYRHRALETFLLAKGKEREGFIKPYWCGRVLRLSILCYCKTYKKISIVCFFFFVWAYACMSPRHACVTGEK